MIKKVTFELNTSSSSIRLHHWLLVKFFKRY